MIKVAISRQALLKACLLLGVLPCVLLGCKNLTEDSSNSAYFGGEIINPKNNFVTLINPNKEVDTFVLNNKNRFFTKLDNFTAGLYAFSHGGEYQTVLLEPADSLLFRLNTLDFDESLVFTGIGAKKNNYLVETFIQNETEHKALKQLCALEPEPFVKHVDSVRDHKLKNLEAFLHNKKLSKRFKTIAKNNIEYNNYYYKEMYPFGYYGNALLVHFKDLPTDFYEYRSTIDYNLEYLSDFYTYNNFLLSHVSNLALKDYYGNTHIHEPLNKYSLKYNLSKLSIIDSLISNPTIKNNLLRFATGDFIYHSRHLEQIRILFGSYLEKSTNQLDKEELTLLIKDVENLQNGKLIANIPLIGYAGNLVNLHDLIQHPTVIYFWTSNLALNNRNTHYKINKLKKQFPNINFIAISIDELSIDYWHSIINNMSFDKEAEFLFKNSDVGISTLGVNYVNKVLVVNADKTIFDARSTIYGSYLENQLKNVTKH